MPAADGALQTALRFLGYRPRSEAEVIEHLNRKGYSASLAELTLEKLRSLRYTDDEIFARNWACSRAEDRGYGPLRIARELGARGIDDPVIRDVIRETFSRHDESDMARQALGKKFRGAKLDDPKTLRRAASFLQRCGYNETVILSVLRQYED